MNSHAIGTVSRPRYDFWGWLREMANEQTSKVQLGFRDLTLVAVISILGSVLTIGVTWGRQSSTLDFEREQRLALEKRVVTLETKGTDLKDHDKLVELGTKMDQLTEKLSQSQKEVQDFIMRQDRIQAYGVGTQNKGRP